MKMPQVPRPDTLNAVERVASISPELAEKLRAAAKDAELLACCAHLEKVLGVDEEHGQEYAHGTVGRDVATLAQCFRGRGPCDSAGKSLWDRFEKKDLAFEKSGVPIEFVLQCVRVGAVRDLYANVQQEAARPVDLSYQLSPQKPSKDAPVTDPFFGADNGLYWANTRIAQLQEMKRQNELEGKRAEQSEANRKKDRVLVEIADQMRVPGYVISPEHLGIVEEGFSYGLQHWKGLLESSSFGRVTSVAAFFDRTHPREITVETYQAFIEALRATKGQKPDLYERVCAQQGAEPPFLQMLNPESGWFYPALLNGWKTFDAFQSAAVCNANGWWSNALKKKV